MKSNFIFFVFLIVLCALGCNKNDIAPPQTVDFGYSYYPNDSGFYKIFEVQEINYNDFQQTIDTINYKVMEIVASTFIDLEGREARRIERYRLKPNGDWQKYDVYQSIKTSLRVEEVSDNLRTVKLVFPISKGVKWNGNAFNTLNEQTYSVVSEAQDTLVNQLIIESLVTIENYRDENILERHVQLEKYAINIGLIHRYFVDLNLQKDSGVVRSFWITETGQYFSF